METIKLIHVSCAVLTILFFAGRGVIMFRHPGFVGLPWVRRGAQGIDTLLFLSGAALAWGTGQLPWQNDWLAAKLAALLVYILLGMVAFHWAEQRKVKLAAWLAALGVVAFIVYMALNRSIPVLMA